MSEPTTVLQHEARLCVPTPQLFNHPANEQGSLIPMALLSRILILVFQLHRNQRNLPCHRRDPAPPTIIHR